MSRPAGWRNLSPAQAGPAKVSSRGIQMTSKHQHHPQPTRRRRRFRAHHAAFIVLVIVVILIFFNWGYRVW